VARLRRHHLAVRGITTTCRQRQQLLPYQGSLSVRPRSVRGVGISPQSTQHGCGHLRTEMTCQKRLMAHARKLRYGPGWCMEWCISVLVVRLIPDSDGAVIEPRICQIRSEAIEAKLSKTKAQSPLRRTARSCEGLVRRLYLRTLPRTGQPTASRRKRTNRLCGERSSSFIAWSSRPRVMPTVCPPLPLFADRILRLAMYRSYDSRLRHGARWNAVSCVREGACKAMRTPSSRPNSRITLNRLLRTI
jgi:hypothetical protein